MIEIDRGDISLQFKTWKKYAKALEKEVKCLQQLLCSEYVSRCFLSAYKETIETQAKRC